MKNGYHLRFIIQLIFKMFESNIYLCLLLYKINKKGVEDVK